MNNHVFIAYHHEDSSSAYEVADGLESLGLVVWIDRNNVRAGEIWLSEVNEAVMTSYATLVLQGPNGIGPFQELELRACFDQAVQRSIPLIPVLLPGSGRLEQRIEFAGRAPVDLRNGVTEPGLRLIAQAVQSEEGNDGKTTFRLTAQVSEITADIELLGFRGTEGISELFRFELELTSADIKIEADDVFGSEIRFAIERVDGSVREFCGILTAWTPGMFVQGRRVYSAIVEPNMALLQSGQNRSIFQNMAVPEIVDRILSEHGVRVEKWLNPDSYHILDAVTQFDESPLNFVSRLLEAEGIFYLLRSEEHQNVLLLADGQTAFTPIGDGEITYSDRISIDSGISSLRERRRGEAKRVELSAYDWRNPEHDLSASAVVSTNRETSSFEFVGNVGERERFKRLLHIKQQEVDCRRRSYDVESSCSTFRAGGRLRASETKDGGEVREFLIEHIRHEVRNGVYTNSAHCLLTNVTYRPSQRTLRPRVAGVHTARVVGPSGTWMYVDEHGRVKVQFPWDRYGRSDENSSQWVRVAQIRASPDVGTLDLPRVGEEVLVSFLDGDPDSPVIIGSLYNARNRPPVDLPAMCESAGRWARSRSNQQSEMLFENRAGEEQIRISTRELILNGESSVRLQSGDLELVLTAGGVSVPMIDDRISSLADTVRSLSEQIDNLREQCKTK